MKKSVQVSVKKLLAVLFIVVLIAGITNRSKADVVAVNPNAPTIEIFNENTWASIFSAPLSMTGFTITGAQSVTWNSDNLLYYAVVRDNAFARHLAIVDISTGVCTDIGTLSLPNVSSMTYNSDLGKMYVMTGSGGTNSESLYEVNLTTAALTFLGGPYSIGGFGEVIAYNFNDQKIYHWSSGGMENIDPVSFVSTPIALSGAPVSEVQGAVYKGGGTFIITDLVFMVSTSAFTITSTGVATAVASTPYQVRGLGYANPLLPVELSSFVANVNGRDVTLNWSTATETNNSGFDLERSASNRTWSKIGNVSGNGTTTSPQNYSYTDRSLTSGTYSYRLKQIDFNGNFEYFNLTNEVNVGVPNNFDLSQNYPNPFNPSTNINFNLPVDSKVSLKIFDMSGKEIMTLVNDAIVAGYHSVNFNASNLSSGVYFYNITAGSFTSTKKMTLIK